MFNLVNIDKMWGEIAADLWLMYGKDKLTLSEEAKTAQKEDAERAREMTDAEVVFNEFLVPSEGGVVLRQHMVILLGHCRSYYKTNVVGGRAVSDYLELKGLKTSEPRSHDQKPVLTGYTLDIPKYDSKWSNQRFQDALTFRKGQ
jgi:hypothetical protein